MTYAGHVSRIGTKIISHKLWSKYLKRRENLKDKSVTWGDNFILDIKDTRFECVEWIHLAEGRDQKGDLLNTEMNLWIP
jgi:hypothetical protein